MSKLEFHYICIHFWECYLNNKKQILFDTMTKDDLADEIICPHCKLEGKGIIIEDYTNMHSREILIECAMCDKLYKIYYKFDRISKLIEE